ncbi:MAG: hypothetical protein PHR19_04945 [Bacteroidales bacterium]|nr:hypothetical protein [Bacteroidales bacterium]
MKKLSVFLSTILAIAIAISFTSCEDPAGVYKPEKKIAKVYEQEVGEPEYLSQEWTWDGNKVASISYYYDGEFGGKDEFTYDGDRVEKIRDNYGYYAEYEYNDKQYEKIEYYNPTNELLAEITFQYDGKKISVITLKSYVVDKNVIKMVERGFIGKMLPKEGMKVVAEKMADQSKETTVMSLSYDGDNISSLTTGSNVFSYSDYDTYSNIWFNFFPFSAYEADANSQIFSKNNPGKVVSQMGSINIPTTFIYTYDGNVPATIQANTTFMGTSSAKTTRFVYN